MCRPGQPTLQQLQDRMLGVLLAIAADGPCNIGIDKSSCIKTCRHLWHLVAHAPPKAGIHGTTLRREHRDRCKRQLRKPWDLQPSGDLHTSIFKFLVAKGLQSVTFTTVKGHATDEHVQQHICTTTQAAATERRTNLLIKERINSPNRL